MTVFSIDLGIDPSATHGHKGSELDPYPMQMSLCTGVFDGDGNFVPSALSSWFMFQSSDQEAQADRLVVRVFDLGSPANDCSFGTPSQLHLYLANLDGTPATTPWTPVAAATTCEMESGPRQSLCYQKPDGECSYPCYKPMIGGTLLSYHLYPAVSPARRFLLTAKIVAQVVNQENPTGATIHFLSDPEVIVSPYGGG